MVKEADLSADLLEKWPVNATKNWQEWNILSLAYLGDAVFELWVRKHLLGQGLTKVEELHKKAVDYVQAKSQAEVIRVLQDELSETETQVFLRGRNAKGHYPRSVDAVTYRHATAFEALVGYWYITDQKERLHAMLERIDDIRAKRGT